MPGKTVKVLYSESVIAERVEAMANDISAWAPKDLMVIAILKGSFMFAADILRALHRKGLAPQVEFMMLSSYGVGTTSSGIVKIIRDIDTDVAGRSVLIIDDILESGRTLAFAKDLLAARGAARLGPGHGREERHGEQHAKRDERDRVDAVAIGEFDDDGLGRKQHRAQGCHDESGRAAGGTGKRRKLGKAIHAMILCSVQK